MEMSKRLKRKNFFSAAVLADLVVHNLVLSYVWNERTRQAVGKELWHQNTLAQDDGKRSKEAPSTCKKLICSEGQPVHGWRSVKPCDPAENARHIAMLCASRRTTRRRRSSHAISPQSP